MTGKPRARGAVAALAVLALALGATACNESEEGHVVEGEPIELGDLRFNVQLTRFLNFNDTEDSEYLEGLPAPPIGEDYLGVFMEVENEGDGPATMPAESEMKVMDTTGEEFEPIETETVFAFPFGLEIDEEGQVPIEDTAAASGPVQGSLVLFLLTHEAAENRPLELELTADGEDGVVELDI